MVCVHNGELRWTLHVLLFKGALRMMSPLLPHYQIVISMHRQSCLRVLTNLIWPNFGEIRSGVRLPPAQAPSTSKWISRGLSESARLILKGTTRCPRGLCLALTLHTRWMNPRGLEHSRMKQMGWVFCSWGRETWGWTDWRIGGLGSRPERVILSWSWGIYLTFTVRLSTQESNLLTASSQRELMNYMEEW